jgi:hypothetical protein
VPDLDGAAVEGLMTYRVPAAGVDGACARGLAPTPFDLRTLLGDGVAEVERVFRLRSVADAISKALAVEWVGVYRVIHHDGM